jgi:hypothetical protein
MGRGAILQAFIQGGDNRTAFELSEQFLLRLLHLSERGEVGDAELGHLRESSVFIHC